MTKKDESLKTVEDEEKERKRIRAMFQKMNDYNILPKGKKKEIEPENVC